MFYVGDKVRIHPVSGLHAASLHEEGCGNPSLEWTVVFEYKGEHALVAAPNGVSRVITWKDIWWYKFAPETIIKLAAIETD